MRCEPVRQAGFSETYVADGLQIEPAHSRSRVHRDSFGTTAERDLETDNIRRRRIEQEVRVIEPA